tara:strand:+ start:64 stop:552 length:489 start_codon:yes stop_codon:yes gene_type:complete
MHGKKNYINKSMYSIQGIKKISKSLPKGFKTILKKGGHNYSTIVNNWVNLVGPKVSSAAYPKTIKTDRELKNGILVLNVSHGDQIFIEYKKKDIADKINSYFGYQFIKEVRLVLIKNKMDKEKFKKIKNDKEQKNKKKIMKIQDTGLKKNLEKFIDIFNSKR